MHSRCLGFFGARSHPQPLYPAPLHVAPPSALRPRYQIMVLLNLYRNPQNTAQNADGSHCE